jgi:hypothetical protein
MKNLEKGYSQILKKCAVIAEERQKQYGSANDSIQHACDILDKLFSIKLTKKEFCYVLVALKLSREKANHKDDNIIDCINYLAMSLNTNEK